MTREDYLQLIVPAIEQAIEHFMEMESKHGEGIFLHDDDLLKAAGHAISAYRGLDNEDGSTHAVALLSRAIKAVLAEVDNGL